MSSAAMTIHPVRMSGTVIAAPQTYSYFQRLQERIVAFVARHSSISTEKFQALMLAKDDMAADVGSVLYGEEAVRLGLIDQLAVCRRGCGGCIENGGNALNEESAPCHLTGAFFLHESCKGSHADAALASS